MRTLPLFQIVAILGLALFAPHAFAQVDTVGGGAEYFLAQGNLQIMMDLLTGVAYLGGCWFGVKSLLLLKDHSDSQGQVKLTKPLMALCVSTLLLSLPSFFEMLSGSLGLTGIAGTLSMLSSMGSSGSGCTATNIGESFVCMAQSIPGLYKLVVLAASAGGAFLIFKTIYMLPQLEQGRASGGQVIWTLLAGVMLWSVLPMVSVAMNSLGGNGGGAVTGVMSKYSQSQSGGFDGAIAACMLFIQFIGLIAFVRGLMILKALGENKDGAMGRALTHIFGGAAAMNIVWMVSILAHTIGFYGTICSISAVLCS